MNDMLGMQMVQGLSDLFAIGSDHCHVRTFTSKDSVKISITEREHEKIFVFPGLLTDINLTIISLVFLFENLPNERFQPLRKRAVIGLGVLQYTDNIIHIQVFASHLFTFKLFSFFHELRSDMPSKEVIA
jgi:hypothetical protein